MRCVLWSATTETAIDAVANREAREEGAYLIMSASQRPTVPNVTDDCPRALSYRLTTGTNPLSPLVSQIFTACNAVS